MARPRLKKSNKKLLTIIGSVSLLLIIAVVAFFLINNDNKKLEDKKPIKKEPPKEVIPEKKLKIVDLESKSRPYAVMINNISTARPLQSGLQDAYIVYEMIVEGGITRYMALFLDQKTERIGSIRSARHYYLDYALENDAIYVHHGQSTQALGDFRNLPLDRIVVDNSKTGWRDRSLHVASEHTLFTNIDKLKNGLGSKRRERKGDLLLSYNVDEIDLSKIDGAIPASNVDITYSNIVKNNFKYSPEEKVYYHSINGKSHDDYVTKKQYTFKNIITYQVENYTLNDPENKGRQGINNIGSGTGYFISNGYAVKINWKKNSRSGKTSYTLLDGTKLVVNDGNTIIEIQPSGKLLGIS